LREFTCKIYLHFPFFSTYANGAMSWNGLNKWL
jgi:hypothetical protein